MTDNLSLVILAGSIGNQYKWQKQIDSIGPNRETLLEYSIYDALAVGIKHFVFIINQEFDIETKKYYQHIIEKNSSLVEFILQTTYTAVPRNNYDLIKDRKKAWGTAHALLIAKSHLSNPFIVIDANHLYGRTTFYKAKELFLERKILPNRFGLITYNLKNTLKKESNVIRGLCTLNKDYLVGIKKFTNIHFNDDGDIVSDEISNDLVFDLEASVSMNFWILHPSIFRNLEDRFIQFLRINSSQLEAKFSLYTVINNMIKENQLEVIVKKSSEQCLEINKHEDKQIIVEKIRDLVGANIYPKILWK